MFMPLLEAIAVRLLIGPSVCFVLLLAAFLADHRHALPDKRGDRVVDAHRHPVAIPTTVLGLRVCVILFPASAQLRAQSVRVLKTTRSGTPAART